MSPNRASSLSKLAAIKSCNYLDNLLAFEDASRSGFNEAIRLNERDEVVSACMANVFWLKNARLFTPSLKTGCLPGTTREFILESLECEEVAESETEINSADAVFLASAGVGVIRVGELDGRKLKAADHPILHLVPAFS
jgi:branched-subunit amino acid aminotransferase/4-amino-4-deoxychorismate lyase